MGSQTCGQQSFNRRQKKIAIAKRWLQQRRFVQIDISGITDQIENEIDDHPPRKNGSPFISTTGRGGIMKYRRRITETRQG